MPTYLLEGTNEVRLTVRPLNMTVRVEGGGVEAWLEVTQGGRSVPSVVRPPSMVILPRVEAATTVSVIPTGRDRFPSQTVVHFSVAVEDRESGDPQRAVLVPVDVSGLDRKDLVSVELVDGALSLRAAQNKEDSDLGALGNAARVAARELLGVQSFDDGAALTMNIAVDRSGSALHLARNGTFAGLVRVLTGVAQVITNGTDISAGIIGNSAERLPSQPLVALPQSVQDAQLSRIPSNGFRSASRLPWTQPDNSNSLTYLLTDSLPADVVELETAEQAAPGRRHIVAVTSPGVWRLLGGTTVHSTVVEPPAGDETLEARLLADPAELRGLVTSLLQSVFDRDTVFAERTGL
ncbi:hypothetical protein E5206_04095 [Arthrobacter sp. PAMC25564]|uniref:hypothetical protein n=1 Tax=Arthrobacter sp. PAMC25564 TaxID=2565366 RepID=UPI0010A1FBCB|nr:hypothetical protein [Arthrobacter sp. PAMC25564]QCB96210.1 hypothetical protein E5206_04095 [Arthrobacter sp. PAMC25564]